MKKLLSLLLVIILSILLVWGLSFVADKFAPTYGEEKPTEWEGLAEGRFNYADVPQFDGSTPYVTVNGNKPYFTEAHYTERSYESYGELDNLGRCTTVCANIGTDIMPTEKRENIGSVKPTGWQVSKYNFVEDEYLFNRCHLIGFQLAGENANEKNLITGTRFMNIEGMLPFENSVAKYVKETGNHVLYRVTPIFRGRELVARGVLMEGFSVEDRGEGICFNVFCYNAQPDVKIDYMTGDNYFVGGDNEEKADVGKYVLNVKGKKFHYRNCGSVSAIKESNKKSFDGSREELIKEGYSPCGSCKP